MRSTVHGSLATVLLLIPILAIPLLAIFGVPEFAPVVESPLDDPQAAAADLGDAPQFSSAPSWEDEPFPASPPSQQQTAADWSQNPPGAEMPAFDDLRARRTASSQPSASEWPNAAAAPRPTSNATPRGAEPMAMASLGSAAPMGGDIYRRPREQPNPDAIQQASGMTAADEPLTWKKAIERLNAREIRNFRLEPGQENGRFVFICSYTPQHDPRLSYRFEAEADEPLRAVEKVLQQIDGWVASR